jgi:hypothetical protein
MPFSAPLSRPDLNYPSAIIERLENPIIFASKNHRKTDSFSQLSSAFEIGNFLGLLSLGSGFLVLHSSE